MRFLFSNSNFEYSYFLWNMKRRGKNTKPKGDLPFTRRARAHPRAQGRVGSAQVITTAESGLLDGMRRELVLLQFLESRFSTPILALGSRGPTPLHAGGKRVRLRVGF